LKSTWLDRRQLGIWHIKISNIWFGNIGGLAGQNELCQELGGWRCTSGASLRQYCEVRSWSNTKILGGKNGEDPLP
jgi:hypothetical protein